MEPIPRGSMVDAAADQLRNAILAGELEPGEPLPLRVLGERLGISHIPIREALRQLTAEGLVVSSPRRTPQVAHVALAELSDIYELRRMIEVPIARRARSQADSGDLTRLRCAYRDFEEVGDEPESPAYWERHRDFHWALIAADTNTWTQRVLAPLWQGTERYVRLFVTTFGDNDQSMNMHLALLRAYEDGDPDVLADALSEHFAETERVVTEGYRARLANLDAATGLRAP